MSIHTSSKRHTITPQKHIGFFVTCLVDSLRPSIGFHCLKILKDHGFTVSVPLSQSCCGQPAYNSGDTVTTKDIALHILKTFKHFDYIITPSGSCAAMIRKHFPHLFPAESSEHKDLTQLAKKTYEFTEFLCLFCNASLPKTTPHLPQKRVTYHDSCSCLRELNLKDAPRKLLKQLPNISLIENSASEICCGFGGLFCLKFNNISAKMTQEKINLILDTQASCVTSTDLGCLINIAGMLKKQKQTIEVRHIAELLANDTTTPSI